MSEGHAVLSPSGAAGWINCPSWKNDTRGSGYAREGTAAHELAAMAITANIPARAYIGRVITVTDGGVSESFEVDEEMADYVQEGYIDHILAVPGDLYVEQKLSIEHITGEAGAVGTSDAVILSGDELIIADLKYGAGVEVSAYENEQLMIYALAALEEFGMVFMPTHVRMMIFQPRRQHISEWQITVEVLLEFAEKAKLAATAWLDSQDGEPVYSPDTEVCRWCARKANCPGLMRMVTETTLCDFDDLTQESLPAPSYDTHGASLGLLKQKTELVSMWVRAVNDAVYKALLNGEEVDGWKMVAGKEGNRQWANKKTAEDVMKSMRLKLPDMYTMNIISPTGAEKLLKKDNPRKWARLQDLIVRAPGGLSVAPEYSRKTAITNQRVATADSFENLEEEALA